MKGCVWQSECVRSCSEDKHSWQKGLTQPVHQFTTTETTALGTQCGNATYHARCLDTLWNILLTLKSNGLGKMRKWKEYRRISEHSHYLPLRRNLVIWCSHACQEHTHTHFSSCSHWNCVYTSADSQTVIQDLQVVSQTADGQQTNPVQTPAVFKPTKTSF